MQLKLNFQHLEFMRSHVETCAPLEACGLLAGKDGSVREIIVITNRAMSPVRFQMEPLEQIQAFNRMEAAGYELLGIFHSHPAGPPVPSATDIAEAAYPVVQIIWSRLKDQTDSGWQARGFWIEDGKALEVTLQMEEDE